jgi:predicted transcriptional regulator
MKTAVSMPDEVFEQAETLAKLMGVSRSALYVLALQEFIERHTHDAITAKLNEVYANSDSSLDPGFVRAQARVLEDEGW